MNKSNSKKLVKVINKIEKIEEKLSDKSYKTRFKSFILRIIGNIKKIFIEILNKGSVTYSNYQKLEILFLQLSKIITTIIAIKTFYDNF